MKFFGILIHGKKQFYIHTIKMVETKMTFCLKSPSLFKNLRPHTSIDV